MTEQDDDGTIARFRRGDAGAFEELLRRHEPALRAHLASGISQRLRRRVSVDDLVQDTFLAAHGARDAFRDRGEGSFRAWLTAIADNRLQDAVRRHTSAAKRSTNREVTRAARPETAYLVAVQRSPSSVVASDEQLDLVRAAMEELSDDYRTVLRLALEQGLSLREVAERMDRSRDATKKLYGRAVCRLRALVEDVDDG